MSKRLRWDLCEQQMRRRSEANDWLNGGVRSLLKSSAHSGELQMRMAFLDETLALPGISESNRSFLEDVRQWVLADARRCISPRQWETIQTIRRFVEMSNRGVKVVRKRPPGVSRAKRWEKPERPAWMDDPSLLPKKPPGAR